MGIMLVLPVWMSCQGFKAFILGTESAGKECDGGGFLDEHELTGEEVN